jgi:hypothetical protein
MNQPITYRQALENIDGAKLTLSAGLAVLRDRIDAAARPIRDWAAMMPARGGAVVTLSPPAWPELFKQLESDL